MGNNPVSMADDSHLRCRIGAILLGCSLQHLLPLVAGWSISAFGFLSASAPWYTAGFLLAEAFYVLDPIIAGAVLQFIWYV